MTYEDFIVLLPMLITAYAGVVMMAVVAFRRTDLMAYVLALITLVAALIATVIALPYVPRAVTGMLIVDTYALYFTGLVLVGAILVTLLSYDYFRGRGGYNAAYYLLLIMAVFGMLVVVSSLHFAAFFLGVETLSISLYGLIGYTREHRPSLEGAIKYLVLAASASAFLLFGIALVYYESGTMDFRALSLMLAVPVLPVTTAFGLALILVLFGFKLALAPFHMWSPDVYQGASAPVTALIATGSKGAVLALLLRLVTISGLQTNRSTFLLIAVLAVATMFVGNLLALLQNNVKRMLAYSSVSQVGYLLIPLLAGGVRGPSSIAFYLASYFATSIVAFGVISVISSRRTIGDVETLDEYRGLGFTHPVLGAIFSLALLSLTGIPPTVGFIAKFYIFSAAVQSGLWALVIIGIINSGMSAFYYLRLVVTMYTHPEAEEEQYSGAGLAGSIALSLAMVVLLLFGIYPEPLVQLAIAATRQLTP